MRGVKIAFLMTLAGCSSAQLEFDRLSSRPQKDCGSYLVTRGSWRRTKKR
jgi:hypothetical protein